MLASANENRESSKIYSSSDQEVHKSNRKVAGEIAMAAPWRSDDSAHMDKVISQKLETDSTQQFTPKSSSCNPLDPIPSLSEFSASSSDLFTDHTVLICGFSREVIPSLLKRAK
jgi:hypothetical protein